MQNHPKPAFYKVLTLFYGVCLRLLVFVAFKKKFVKKVHTFVHTIKKPF